MYLCRAAISMLGFLTRPHSVKMTAIPISEYLAQFLLGTPNLVKIILARFSVELLNNGFDRKLVIYICFLKLWVKFYKGKGELFSLSSPATKLLSFNGDKSH